MSDGARYLLFHKNRMVLFLTVQYGENDYGAFPMKVRTQQHYATEWTAIDHDTYDGPESPIGMGKTEQEAIADLKEQLDEPIPLADR